MSIAALLVAGGTGSRFGGTVPKQFAVLSGMPVIRHAAIGLLSAVSRVQPVGDPVAIGHALAGLAVQASVPGGATRQASVRAGLEALATDPPDLVLIHDAARPNIPAGLIGALCAALATAPAAIPAVPVTDTLKRADSGGQIAGTVARDGLVRVQTPQAFRYAPLLALHRSATADDATDDAWLCERAGLPVTLLPGDESNIKVTLAQDLARLERIMSPTLVPHVGTGFDVHAFADGRPLIVCGVPIPYPRGLAGHSDADVGLHALCDAIYGALAEGDIGRHFPPSETTWKDADSARFLTHARARVAARFGRIVNIDLTLICERPKITPHAPAMIARLATLLALDPARVSVKGTTTERLGFTGREEGIAAQAVVCLLLPDSG